MEGISGLKQNGIVTGAIVVYCLVAIGGSELLARHSILLSSTSRKIVHIAAASWLIFWPLMDDETDGTWRLNVLVPLAKAVELFVKGAIVRDPNDTDVKAMSRTGDPTELLYGPLQFSLLMVVVGLFLFKEPVSCLIMGAAGIGDGIAPLIGSKFGKHKYKSLDGHIRSLEGSFAVICGSIMGYYGYSWALETPLISFPYLLLASIIAAFVEGASPSNIDNITVSVAMYFLFPFLQ